MIPQQLFKLAFALNTHFIYFNMYVLGLVLNPCMHSCLDKIFTIFFYDWVGVCGQSDDTGGMVKGFRFM